MRMKCAGALWGLTLLAGSLPALAQPTPEIWMEPNSGIEFVRIEQGCFSMGTDYPREDSLGEPSLLKFTESPRHQVCVDGFWLGRLEVSRAQWLSIMAPAAAATEPQPRLPMLNVAWEDAQEFLRRMNALPNGKPALYRLPTEAEWEYACNVGKTENPDPLLRDGTALEARLLTIAWYQEPQRYEAAARKVGEMNANAWGLHDMQGNAAEWVQDDFVENGYARHEKLNPVVALDGTRHVIRGGSFRSDAWNVRCGSRNFGVPGDRLPTVGLRIVKTGDVRP